jgi:hypothetical protein
MVNVVAVAKLPDGDTVNHAPFVDTLNVVPLEGVTVKLCAAGTAPPTVPWNVKDDWLKVKGPALPPPFAISTIGMEIGLLARLLAETTMLSE